MITVKTEPPDAHAAIEDLLDRGFGPNRRQKSSYSYRQGVEKLDELCLTAFDGDTVAGTIRAWPVAIGHAGTGILIGPVAVDKEYQDLGLGARLIMLCLDRARKAGWRAAVLVGDKPYYGRFGFTEAAEFGIRMSRENPARVLALPLRNGLSVPSGLVSSWRYLRHHDAA